MLDFHVPALDDKPWIDEIFQGTEYFGCFCSFATLWLWKDMYATQVARLGDALLIRGKNEAQQWYYMYPMGRSYDVRETIEALRADAACLGTALRISCAEQWQCDELLAAFPQEFVCTENRADFDYMYRSENLIHLSGKKFHAKRNHISRFIRAYPDWRYEDISAGNLPECIAFIGAWLEKAIAGEDAEQVYELCMENSAIALALRHFDMLGLAGGLLRADGRIIALTIGEPLNRRVFVTHFEKADTDYDGAYTMMNREFALHRLADYEFINREEDMGLEGLRKAELSYHPDILLDKYEIQDISHFHDEEETEAAG